ncbi:MAG: SMI1/KNR4 family protein [Leptolyngbyaceae cyanobacterium bins.302]|nr:SMI1/KNR4 family protein [Leptolyngbyaceae cyanobacterium bins.302]
MREDMADWKTVVADWQTRYHFSVPNPVEPQVLNEVEAKLGGLPTELKSLYQFCNGITSGWFKVLPVEDPTDIKHTWDGIRRANDSVKPSYLEQNQELLQQVLVFASLDAGQCAAIDSFLAAPSPVAEFHHYTAF